jgi:very-short-patch-repair endonuclease
MIDDFELRQLASRQHGLVSFEQLAGLGFDEDGRRELVDGRRWERRAGRVFRLVGATETVAHRLSHAVLASGPGAALAGETSAAFWGVRGTVYDPVVVARPRDHARRTDGARKRLPTLLPESHILVLDGIRTVTPARALFDMAGSHPGGAHKQWWIDKMHRVVNNARTDGLVSSATLEAMLRDVAQRGRPGIRVMRRVLAQLGPDEQTPGSGAETRVQQICERHGLPPMRRQVNLGDGERWIGRVDFLAPDVPFVLEVQSARFHGSDLDRQLDGERRARLEAAGYVVAEVTTDDVWYRPEVVVATIVEGRRRAAARLGSLA